MDWIKKNYDRFMLVLAACVLTGFSVLLYFQGVSFKKGLDDGASVFVRSRKMPEVNVVEFQEALRRIEDPSKWGIHKKPMFVSEKYLVKDGKLVNPIQDDGTPIHPPVPNRWFDDAGLDLLDPKVLTQDPDKDGFTNLEEFSAKTDPQDPKSHPEYITKLRLQRVIKKPFRFIFKSWFGNPEQPESLDFQIETVDLKQPTQFVKMNAEVRGTSFKVTKFEMKSFVDSNQIRKDASELSLQSEDGESMVLVVEKTGNLPKVFVRFKYLWNGTEFEVKQGQEFALEPDAGRKYKVIDISSTQALVLDVASGQSVAIPLLEEMLH